MDPGRIGSGVSSAFTVSPFSVRVLAMQFTTVSSVRRTRPRQLRRINEKSLCSIFLCGAVGYGELTTGALFRWRNRLRPLPISGGVRQWKSDQWEPKPDPYRVISVHLPPVVPIETTKRRDSNLGTSRLLTIFRRVYGKLSGQKQSWLNVLRPELYIKFCSTGSFRGESD